MKMNPINDIGMPNVQTYKTPINKNLYTFNIQDTVSFKGNNEYKYNDSWYLKDETIIGQDDFSTTIEDTNAKKSFLDKITKKSYPKKIYDLPLRLREELQAEKTDTVVLNAPNDLLEKTGLTNEEFLKEINKINALISLVYPRYDMFEEKTKQNFQIKLGNSLADVTRVSQGLSGIIYKIEVEGCKPLALKHYLNPVKINLSEGAFPEIAIAKKMNRDNVSDIPLLYCANPYEGWMLSEFADENYEKRKGGFSFLDYAEKNNLALADENSGLAVKTKSGLVFVDFGYISTAGSKTSVNGFDDVVFDDNKVKTASKDYQNSKQASLLAKTENINLYGTPETLREFLNAYENDPEFMLFTVMMPATNFALSGMKLPEELKENLQNVYEKSGFLGDAVELAESCNQ